MIHACLASSRLSTVRTLSFNFRRLPAAPRPAMTALQRDRLFARVDALTCSRPWTDSVSAAAEAAGINPAQANLPRQLAERGLYPPPADAGADGIRRAHAVRMCRCDACGRIVPPHNLASHRMVRVCDDCRAQPETDLDLAVETPVARTPGVRFDALLKGPHEDDHPGRQDARRQLAKLGLSDAEILAMSFNQAGYSTRRIAEFGGWSQTYACKLIAAAARKIRRSGLKVPEVNVTASPLRVRTVNPQKLDALPDSGL